VLSLDALRRQAATLPIAERLFDAAVLCALFELDVFAALASGAKTLDELRRTIRADRDTLEAILDAAVALKILDRQDGAYAASDALVDCLGHRESPAYLGEWVAFLGAIAPSLFDLGRIARSGVRADGEALVRIRTRAMDVHARTRGFELAERIDFSDAKTLLDVGCGSGGYSLAIVERYPQIAATLLDLPEPLAEARAIAAERRLGERMTFVAGDALGYSAATTFDVVLMSNLLHMLGDARALELVRRALGLVAPGGRIVIQGEFLDDDRTSPRWATLLNLVLHAITPHGRNHTVAEASRWLREAGFEESRHVRFSAWNANSALIARRPR
jgi:SAM-dependent methyltransferase